MRIRRLAVVLVVIAAVGVVSSSAEAASLRACGKVAGWRVRADSRTTTCRLARSAARDYVRRLARGDAVPRRIVGRSPKTRKRYRFRWVRSQIKPKVTSTLYRGHAGRAVLRVKISHRR